LSGTVKIIGVLSIE